MPLVEEKLERFRVSNVDDKLLLAEELSQLFEGVDSNLTAEKGRLEKSKDHFD